MEQPTGDQSENGAELKMTVRLVTPAELAKILNVPLSWIYRAKNLPCIRVGKYRRYNSDEVIASLKNGSQHGGGHEQKA